MIDRLILVAVKSTYRRNSVIHQVIERMQKEDTVFIPIGYWERDDTLSYRDGINWMVESFRYLDTPQNTLIVIDDIVPLIDTPEGYLFPLLLELYKEKGVRFVMGTSLISSDYLTPHLRSLCSTVISTMVNSEMQSRLLVGTRGAEILEDDEYLMKRKGRITKGLLHESYVR